jgi:hypothetical protein
MLALTRALPKEFRSTNIEMLSADQEARIEECFRDENRWLLNTYCSDADVDRIYRTHFMPRKADARYSDMTESELIYRCLGIILESIASSAGQNDRGKNRESGARFRSNRGGVAPRGDNAEQDDQCADGSHTPSPQQPSWSVRHRKPSMCACWNFYNWK